MGWASSVNTVNRLSRGKKKPPHPCAQVLEHVDKDHARIVSFRGSNVHKSDHSL